MSVQPEVKESTAVKIPEADTKTQSSPTQTPPVPSDSQTPPEESIDQINWRKFRQERDKERKEKIESDKRLQEKQREAAALKEAMEALLNKPTVPQTAQEEEESEEQRIDRRVAKALDEKDKQYKAEQYKREQQELPQKLSREHPDFNQVCSQENMDYLEYHHPRIWKVFKNSAGDFDAWSGLYDTVKKLVPTPDSRKDSNRIEKNLSKPQSLSTPGMSQTGDHAPMNLTDQKRKDNWARMQRIMKGV